MKRRVIEDKIKVDTVLLPQFIGRMGSYRYFCVIMQQDALL